MFGMQTATAFGHFVSGRYVEALSSAETAFREQPNFFIGQCVAAASGALAGKLPRSGESDGASTPAQSGIADFQPEGSSAFRAAGGFRPVGGGPAQSWPAGVTARKIKQGTSRGTLR